MQIGSVREIWRFPVKSMGGERVAATSIGERGVHGDRLWAVRDDDKQTLTNAKRLPKLLMVSARFAREPTVDVGPGAIPEVVIEFPDGRSASSADPGIHALLSDFVEARVTLCPLRAASDKAHYKGVSTTANEMRALFGIEDGEPLPDFSMMPIAKLLELDKYATPPGTYFDAMALHIVTSATLGDLDARRFRANIVIDGGERYGEVEWTGGTLALGGCTVAIDCPTPRCSMPTRAQPGIPADKTVLATIARDAGRCFGVYATPTKMGALRVGDPVTLAPPSKLAEWARKRANRVKRVLISAKLPK